MNSVITLLLCLVAVATADGDMIVARQAGTANLNKVTCGRNTYSRKQVDEATAEGCRLFSAHQQLGNNNYPHRFNNREKLVFAAAGPYQEFPILTTGNYPGRSPGADRIVFSEGQGSSCAYVGAMTHTDAPTNNGFVLCVESKASSTQTSASQSSSRTAFSASSTQSSSASLQGANWPALGLGGLLALFLS